MTPEVTSAVIVKKADLYCTEGSSDKVYHVALVQTDTGFDVLTAYGRRGNGLNFGDKGRGLDEKKAEKAYQKLVDEKMAKGYNPAPGISGRVFNIDSIVSADASVSSSAGTACAPKQRTGFSPQLLNSISQAECERLLSDDAWGMQEKKNGTRHMVRYDGSTIVAANKKGQQIPVVPEIGEVITTYGVPVLPDGELVSGKLHAFDLPEIEGVCIRAKNTSDRFLLLDAYVEALGDQQHIVIVPLMIGEAAKRAEFARIKDAKGEGVVFRGLDAPYTEGKPASAGTCLKFKFVDDCSVIVLERNEGKRSVQVGVLKGDGSTGEILPIGNVTIPANASIPAAGEIVDVQYLYIFPGGSLYQPVYLGPRSDVSCDECIENVLKYVNPCAN